MAAHSRLRDDAVKLLQFLLKRGLFLGQIQPAADAPGLAIGGSFFAACSAASDASSVKWLAMPPSTVPADGATSISPRPSTT